MWALRLSKLVKWKTLVLLYQAGKSGIAAKGLEELDADLQQDVPDVVKKQLRAVALLRRQTSRSRPILA
jgi:hypothetical protein